MDFLANDAGGVLTGDDLPNGRTPKRALSALASAPADASDVSSNTPVSGGRIMVVTFVFMAVLQFDLIFEGGRGAFSGFRIFSA